jgi:hypothetical protein
MSNSQKTLRTATVLSGNENLADENTPYNRGVIITVVTTSEVSSGSLVVKLQGKTKLGTYYDLPGAATAAITTETTTTLVVAPGVAATANVSVPCALPRVWRAVLTISGGTFVTAVTADMVM